MLNTFDTTTTTTSLLQRLEKLSPDTRPRWGKMDAAQMLAHVNVTYHIAYGEIPIKRNFLSKFAFKVLVKPFVVNEKPYYKNSRTADVFIIADQRDFYKEKATLIKYIGETEKNGVAYFEGKDNPSFGPMTAREWSNLFYKHIDHHFSQFGI